MSAFLVLFVFISLSMFWWLKTRITDLRRTVARLEHNTRLLLTHLGVEPPTPDSPKPTRTAHS
ncbi:hypothetical protein GCM10022221_23950 [Actinocorallia aurea]